jgi:CRP/FNR family transcriptional regulator, cyclic AMP receptor protein
MTSVETLNALLSKYPFTEELRPKDVQRLCSLGREVSFRKNEIIFREGDECGVFYLLMSGSVILEIPVSNSVLGIETLGPGDEFGWSSMLMRDRRHFQARAREAAHALAFDGAELIRACKEDPVFGFAFLYRVLGVVSRRLQATRMRLLDTYAAKPEDAAMLS